MIELRKPTISRRARDDASYLDELAATPRAGLEYLAVALYGPRNRISALTKRLPLLGQDHGEPDRDPRESRRDAALPTASIGSAPAR